MRDATKVKTKRLLYPQAHFFFLCTGIIVTRLAVPYPVTSSKISACEGTQKAPKPVKSNLAIPVLPLHALKSFLGLFKEHITSRVHRECQEICLNVLNLMEAHCIQILDPTANIPMLLRLVFVHMPFPSRQQVVRQPERMFLDVVGIPQASVSCCQVQLPTSRCTKECIDQTMAHKNPPCSEWAVPWNIGETRKCLLAQTYQASRLDVQHWGFCPRNTFLK